MTALIILPGLDGTGTQHSDFLGALGGAFDRTCVITYPTDQLLGYAELEGLLRPELPPSEPFVLLGESFAGPIALAIAAKPPANLVGLVLSTTFARRAVAVPGFLVPLLRLAPVRAVPTALLSWWLLGRWATPSLIVALKQSLRAVSPAVLRFRAAATLRVREPPLANIRVPVLYLRARNDRLISAGAADYLQASIAQCHIVDIAGPHLLLQAAPQEFAHAVAEFSRQIASP